ncbi:MAG: NADP-dependent oxidoreductase [Pseudomonadota bacterium]
MKAIVLSEYGGPNQLVFREHPTPEPGAGQIKVRVASASINPVDWKLRSGALKAVMPLELPAVLGRDAAGKVVKVGPSVTQFEVGDSVLGLVNGAYAEFVVAPTDAWAKLPAGLEELGAGALPLVLLTGDQLAAAALGNAPAAGQTVLVTGAVGGVGRTAAWVAKQRGAKVLAGVRGTQIAQAEELGLDGVVALDDDAALQQLAPVDCIADTVGGQTIARLFSKLKTGGTIGSVVGEPAGAKEHGFTVNAFFAHPDSARLAELAEAVAAGKLRIPIGRRFPLAEAAAAQVLAEQGGIGKVLLVI